MTDDLTDRCLLVAAEGERAASVLEVGIRRGSAPDGRDLEPVRVDALALEAELPDEVLELLWFGAGAVVDLDGVGPRLFRVLAWQARAHPRSVVFMRHGRAAFPLDLHAFAVRRYDASTPEGAAAARREISRLATLAAAAQASFGTAGDHPASPAAAARRRRRWLRTGIVSSLHAAARRLHVGDPSGAAEALDGARAEAPRAVDLALRAAVLHREASLWQRARREVEVVLEADPGCATAWRELGIARDRQGLEGAAEALRKAVERGEDYEALVALALLETRRGANEEALPLLERAMRASEGQLNLVLPAAVLRTAHHGRVVLSPDDRAGVEEVLAIRGEQAEEEPPEDGPWSHFDAAQACLLLGRCEDAARFAAGAKPFLHAPWETQTFGRGLDALEGAGVDVAAVRAVLGLRPRAAEGTARGPAAQAPAGPPFPVHAVGLEDYRANVPCAAACPVGTDAGAYVTHVAHGLDAEAYRIARGPNPFASVCGRVCAAPCEDACRRGRVDEPVAIRALKRYLTERHGPESQDNRIASVLDGSVPPAMESDAYVSHLRKLGAGTTTGHRIAVVGGGPSGLACAHDLAFLGHRVTVFEATERLGGMMRLGIPEYRLPRDVLDAEIDAILSLGVEVRTNAGLGAQRTLERLFLEGFEAIFLASGAGRGRDLEVDGGDLDGVVRAIDFLINVNAGFRMDIGGRVVVVGGGNVAMDVARTARLGRPPDVRPPTGPARALPGVGVLRSAVSGGAKEVHVVARQPMGEWPAQRSVHGREEVEEALQEGVAFHPLRGVRRILGEDGRVAGVELAEVVALRDAQGRYAPVYGAHVAETIACDTVFLAVGQEPDLDYLAGTQALRRTRDGLIETDPETLTTSLPGVYAGGDAAFGPRTLIEAVAEGKRAARGIHARLSSGAKLGFQATFTELHPRAAAPAPDYDRIPRVEPSCVSVDRRTGIAEVEGSYDEEEARRQASRCLACHVQTIYDGSLCIACGRCTDVCPYRCLSLVPLPLVGAQDLPSLAASGEDTVMVKDETSCIRCGLCAERCPTGAMTMERFDWKVGATLT